VKILFHYREGQAELLLMPETKRDETHIELLKGCEDLATIGPSKPAGISILFKEKKLEV